MGGSLLTRKSFSECLDEIGFGFLSPRYIRKIIKKGTEIIFDDRYKLLVEYHINEDNKESLLSHLHDNFFNFPEEYASYIDEIINKAFDVDSHVAIDVYKTHKGYVFLIGPQKKSGEFKSYILDNAKKFPFEINIKPVEKRRVYLLIKNA